MTRNTLIAVVAVSFALTKRINHRPPTQV